MRATVCYPVLMLLGVVACTASVTPEQTPVGTWNLTAGDVTGRAIGGQKKVILKVEETDAGFHVQMTSVANTLIDVDEFRFEYGTMAIENGAYSYTLSIEDDRLSGTVVSPFGEIPVSGQRQHTGLIYVGEPETFYTRRTGTVGHRTAMDPPEEVEDPATWVRERLESAEDLALIVGQRDRLVIQFSNVKAFEAQLLEYAGREVLVKGTWVGDKVEIDTIEPAPAEP